MTMNPSEPLFSGPPCLAEIEAARPPAGTVAAWWLGQHSFILKYPGGMRIGLDLFLSDTPKRLLPPLARPDQLSGLDIIVGTHDHGDHIDRPAWPILARNNPRAQFVVPRTIRDRLAADLGLPLERVHGVDVGMPFARDAITITALPAAHERLEASAHEPGHSCLGVVVEMAGTAIYHAGDTCLYEGIWAALRRWPRLAAMLLPINGRDAARYGANIIGNMTWQEAVDLAGELRPGLAVPAHWGMFSANTEDPAKFADYARLKYPDLRVHVPTPGGRWIIG